MKGVILVGGSGTRLRPVTYEIPKPLVPVRKKPIVNHLIEFFARHGVDDIALLASAGHKEDFERWEKTWAASLPTSKITIFYEEKPRGTFGGLFLLRDWLDGENFILSNGDELKDFDIPKIVQKHTTKKSVGTIALVEVPNPSEYGVPIMEGDTIKEFLEKPKDPPSHYVNSGLYALHPDILNYADPNQEVISIEKDVFPLLAEKGLLTGVKLENARWYDCGNLERWEKAIREW
jgi:NDP-sugar pyrophosphorylase family protein